MSIPVTPNYNETDITGQSWQRSHHVSIENPLGGLPKLTFGEQRVFVIGGKTVSEFVRGNLSVAFDQNNPKHVALYIALNELYVDLREQRDNPAP